MMIIKLGNNDQVWPWKLVALSEAFFGRLEDGGVWLRHVPNMCAHARGMRLSLEAVKDGAIIESNVLNTRWLVGSASVVSRVERREMQYRCIY
jgi:hypothetical protein